MDPIHAFFLGERGDIFTILLVALGLIYLTVMQKLLKREAQRKGKEKVGFLGNYILIPIGFLALLAGICGLLIRIGII